MESARLDAEVLLAHAIGADRAYVLTHPEQLLDERQYATFRHLIERRVRHEPIAYLTGRRDWYDFTVEVSSGVLVPRPETEGLLELALRWAERRAVRTVADVGTGSAVLAIGLARALPGITVHAIDLSARALEIAGRNVRKASVERRVTLCAGDLLSPLSERVDLIVANLPYVGTSEYDTLSDDIRLHEPREALVGGEDGHEVTARMIGMAPRYLRCGGAVFIELGPAQACATLAAARTAFPGAAIHVRQDYAGLDRYLTVETDG